MKIDVSQQTRLIVLAALLGFAALAGGAFLFVRPKASPSTTAPAPTRHARPVTSTTPAPSSTTPTPAAKTPASGLPKQVAAALDADRIVVIGLYAPGIALDEAALREAQDGANRAKAVFVPVDVNSDDVESLSDRFGAMSDPAVLVLRPPAELAVRIDGFADTDTVAQAAANASQ
jgi:hypothetical protein